MELKDTEKQNLVSFLLNVSPSKLSYYCAGSKEITEVCSKEDFVKQYSARHKKEITKRKLKVSVESFVPKSKPKTPPRKSPVKRRKLKISKWLIQLVEAVHS